MGLYEKIKMLSLEKRISIRSLEDKLGYGNGTIRRWDISIPSVEKLQKVADYFEVSVDYLLGRSDFKEVTNLENKDVETIAAHVADKNRKLSEEELEDIKDYIDYIISKHDKK